MKFLAISAFIFVSFVSAAQKNSTTPSGTGKNTTTTNPDPAPAPGAAFKVNVDCPAICPADKGYFYRLKPLTLKDDNLPVKRAPLAPPAAGPGKECKCKAGKVCDENGKCVDPKTAVPEPGTIKFSCECAKLDLVPFAKTKV